jgi:phage tail-like protein
MALPTERKNPYAAFNFKVFSGTEEIAGFMEASGLDGENAIIEYREGNDQLTGNTGAFVRKQPGLERYPNVVLKRGITGSKALWTRHKGLRDGTTGPGITKDGKNPTTVDFFVELQDEVHNTVFKWKLQNAWISKLSGPSLNAKSNEIAIESVEIVCERIEVVDDAGNAV